MIENTRAQHVYESIKFDKARINKACWKDQLGNLRTAVEYQLTKDTYLIHTAFHEDN